MKREKLDFKTCMAAHKLYRACMKNAGDLLEDARFLFVKKRYSTAFFLAYSAQEEVNKSQIVADYANSDLSKAEFEKAFYSHAFKLSYVGLRWAEIKGKIGVYRFKKSDQDTNGYFKQRNRALYVYFGDALKPIIPADMFTEKAVSALIETVSDEILEIHKR